MISDTQNYIEYDKKVKLDKKQKISHKQIHQETHSFIFFDIFCVIPTQAPWNQLEQISHPT